MQQVHLQRSDSVVGAAPVCWVRPPAPRAPHDPDAVGQDVEMLALNGVQRCSVRH
jgi:hypothetical protein